MNIVFIMHDLYYYLYRDPCLYLYLKTYLYLYSLYLLLH